MVDPITIITTVVPFFKTLTTAKNPLKTSVTIVFENNCSYTLIHPTKYCASGKDVNPPSPIISPGGINTIAAKFEGRNGTVGMLCYQIEGLYGPKNDPYYLLIMWKVNRLSQNKFYMSLYESKEPPLSGNSNQKKFFYKSMQKMYKWTYGESFLVEGKKFRVGGTISSNDLAEIKISLEDYTNVTISLKNNCSYSLINPTHYCNRGDISPPSPLISSGGISIITAKFEGRNGTMGMLCYQIEGSYGPKNDPYYLIITWRMKRFSQSEFYMNFYESKESPLSGNGNQKEFFYESMHRSNNEGFLLEGKKLRVGGTITNNDSAEIKIFLENHKSPKKRLLRKIRSFLTKKFRKKKTR
ncbi:hypothetical protein GLOIN_2v1868886 [Rhizophagus clarus]|uniref:Uncharacterized protein n=1 Tax=Rhizophagus clarus TaxID=94130 RepID=A0A8H3KUD3_9GLOM|nr:hypothetical protein GLOIN_2v1868886 [Rhizophagus clarus]